MQIGPRIRVGGSVGKLGQKAKVATGKALRNPLVLAAIGAASGGAAVPLLLGAAGGALKEKAGVGDVLGGAAKGGVSGMGGAAVRGGISALRGGAGVLNTAKAIGGETGMGKVMGAAKSLTDPSQGGRFRTLMDLGQMGEGVYDRYQENQDRKFAEREYAEAKPLRDAAQAALLDTSRPDVSSIFADPMAPQGRYRRVNVGSMGGL